MITLAAMLTNPFTAVGAGPMLTNPFTAVGAGPMLLIKRKVLNAAVDIAAEQLLDTGRPVQESGKILEDVGGSPRGRPARCGPT